jgi:ketosteroid isomerase-like protein
MSQENVELIRATYEALSRGDFQTVLGDTHPDFEIRPIPGLLPFFSEPVKGRGEAERFWSGAFEPWDEIRIEPRELRDAGDVVVADVRMWGRGPQGVEVPQTYADLWTFRDGRLARLEGFTTVAEALEAAGLQQ